MPCKLTIQTLYHNYLKFTSVCYYLYSNSIIYVPEHEILTYYLYIKCNSLIIRLSQNCIKEFSFDSKEINKKWHDDVAYSFLTCDFQNEEGTLISLVYERLIILLLRIVKWQWFHETFKIFEVSVIELWWNASPILRNRICYTYLLR